MYGEAVCPNGEPEIREFLQLHFKIDHINKLPAAFKYRVVVVVCKKIFYVKGFAKAAFFVKRNRCRGVAGAYP